MSPAEAGAGVRRHEAAVDGLRGCAALLVVASHAGNMGLHLLPGLSFAGAGKYGVFLFFVISAYLLTGQWLARGAVPLRQPLALWPYLKRRVLRIYPLYTLVLLTGWALAPRNLGVPMDGAAALRHLLLLEGRELYWSIPVEFSYYLVIPLLAAWLLTRWPVLLRLGVVLFAVLLLGLAWPPSAAPPNADDMVWYLPVLVAGSLAAWAARSLPAATPRALSATLLVEALFAALLLLSLPSVLMVLGLSGDPQALHRSFVGWGLFWSALVLALRTGWMPHAAWLLARPALRACGRWCFGIYLLHMPVLLLMQAAVVRLHLPTFVAAWLALLLVLALAAAAWRVIESPALRLAR